MKICVIVVDKSMRMQLHGLIKNMTIVVAVANENKELS
jgi:hypothetical protein